MNAAPTGTPRPGPVAGGSQRVSRFVDFVNGSTSAYDDFGHKVGTHESQEGQIFIEPQGFCVLAGIGLDGRKFINVHLRPLAFDNHL